MTISKRDLNGKLDYLNSLKLKMQERDAVKKYLLWVTFSPEKKIQLRDDWLEYFKSVRELSPIYKTVMEMRDVLRKGDEKRFRELQAIMEDLKINYIQLPKPDFVDPQWLEYGAEDVVNYKRILSRIDEVETQLRQSGDMAMLARDIFV